jgi:hypothetical protein
MTFDELLGRVASEPSRTEERDVDVATPELLRELEQRPGMLLAEFVADPRKTRERRTLRTGHVLGPPLTVDAIRSWQLQWRRHPLPNDLIALLLRVNGIHLWADLDTGRAYEGLAPLAEWDIARAKMYGPAAPAESLGDQYLALTYHADGSAFVVLDVDGGGYYLMDSCGPDLTCPVGRSANDLLDYLWSHRIP